MLPPFAMPMDAPIGTVKAKLARKSDCQKKYKSLAKIYRLRLKKKNRNIYTPCYNYQMFRRAGFQLCYYQTLFNCDYYHNLPEFNRRDRKPFYPDFRH